nr:hypothetical protein [Candidatus Brachybacter algidus]
MERVQAEETIEFEIPAGVSDGMQLSMSGKVMQDKERGRRTIKEI